MAYSTTHEEKLSQEELSKIQETQEQTLADYYKRRLEYWDYHIVKNVSHLHLQRFGRQYVFDSPHQQRHARQHRRSRHCQLFETCDRLLTTCRNFAKPERRYQRYQVQSSLTLSGRL